MNDQTQDWDIGRQGRRWAGPEGLAKLERLPGRLELVHGKLSFDEVERRTLLAGLMENMGLDEVVQFGKPFLKASDFEVPGIRAALLEKLGQMIEQSGGARDIASLSAWLDAWLAEPQPELSGATPAQILRDEDGVCRVETLLERMRGGLPG